MKVLGIDYGTKRIGIAISDETKLLARELDILFPREFWDQIQSMVEENDVDTIVVGLPIGVSGNDTQKTEEVRHFVDEIQKKIPQVEVHTMDERFSTSMAQKLPGGGSNVDSLAAQIILQNYLDKIQK